MKLQLNAIIFSSLLVLVYILMCILIVGVDWFVLPFVGYEMIVAVSAVVVVLISFYYLLLRCIKNKKTNFNRIMQYLILGLAVYAFIYSIYRYVSHIINLPVWFQWDDDLVFIQTSLFLLILSVFSYRNEQALLDKRNKVGDFIVIPVLLKKGNIQLKASAFTLVLIATCLIIMFYHEKYYTWSNISPMTSAMFPYLSALFSISLSVYLIYSASRHNHYLLLNFFLGIGFLVFLVCLYSAFMLGPSSKVVWGVSVMMAVLLLTSTHVLLVKMGKR